MYDFWRFLFGDYPGGNIWEIKLFNGWHFLYIALILGLTGLLTWGGLVKKEKRNRCLNAVAGILVAVYLLDFMIQPFMTDSFSMNIDKLPFHICIVMCPFIVLVQFCRKAAWLKMPVAVFSLVHLPRTAFRIRFPEPCMGHRRAALEQYLAVRRDANLPRTMGRTRQFLL